MDFNKEKNKQDRINKLLLDAAYAYMQDVDDEVCIEWCKIYISIFKVSPTCHECGSVGNYLSGKSSYKCECGNAWGVNKGIVKKKEDIKVNLIQKRLNKVIEG